MQWCVTRLRSPLPLRLLRRRRLGRDRRSFNGCRGRQAGSGAPGGIFPEYSGIYSTHSGVAERTGVFQMKGKAPPPPVLIKRPPRRVNLFSRSHCLQLIVAPSCFVFFKSAGFSERLAAEFKAEKRGPEQGNSWGFGREFSGAAQLTWMLSSTFFHWQKRVNLSLRNWGEKKRERRYKRKHFETFGSSLKKKIKKINKKKSAVSPLDELLEDLSSQAVADLHDVWLRRDRDTSATQVRFPRSRCARVRLLTRVCGGVGNNVGEATLQQRAASTFQINI